MHEKQYDAAHFSFLEMIRVVRGTSGPAYAKGALVRVGMGAAAHTPKQEYASFEDFLASIEAVANPIAHFEGASHHYGDGLFGLPFCPFASSIKTYTRVTGGTPKEYDEVTDEMNKPSRITEELRVGFGAAVSPFCAVHQPIRSVLAGQIEVAGKPLKVYQLGCKSGSGHKAISDRWVEETGVDRALVDKILDTHMCCYVVRLAD